MAVTANLSIDQGSTFSTLITCTGPDGAPLDLTGYLVRGQMRRSYGSSTSHNFVCTVDDAEEGIIKMAMTANTTGGLKPQRYVYDVEIVSPTSEVTRVVEGQVEVNPRVTLPPE
jgi:hypothetical protein